MADNTVATYRKRWKEKSTVLITWNRCWSPAGFGNWMRSVPYAWHFDYFLSILHGWRKIFVSKMNFLKMKIANARFIFINSIFPSSLIRAPQDKESMAQPRPCSNKHIRNETASAPTTTTTITFEMELFINYEFYSHNAISLSRFSTSWKWYSFVTQWAQCTESSFSFYLSQQNIAMEFTF